MRKGCDRSAGGDLDFFAVAVFEHGTVFLSDDHVSTVILTAGAVVERVDFVAHVRSLCSAKPPSPFQRVGLPESLVLTFSRTERG